MQKDVKIGLEIHGYLDTNEKLFCQCKNNLSETAPNTNICPICTGTPGSKPMMPNAKAVTKLIQTALMLNTKINFEKSLLWQRKHYDWPDLPKGYQISMSGSHSTPLAEKGKFEGINIIEIHGEEDPAAWNPPTGEIDYNRSGVPLIEIVTSPDFHEAEIVAKWLNNLILALSYIKSISKKAGIKVDVNISLNKEEGKERVEIKNLHSIEDIKNAINFEIQRQEKEGTQRETRRYDSKRGKTIKMRDKETAEDYRFIPDPDLPQLVIKEEEAEKIRNALPETPQEKLVKLTKQHKLDKISAEILSKNLEIVEFFESVAQKVSPKFALPWIVVELMRVLNYNKKTLEEVNIKTEHFIELLQAVKENKLTELKAKQILNNFIPISYSLKDTLKKEEKITHEEELKKLAEQAIAQNEKAVNDYKSGKKEALSFLLGEIMKLSKKRADYAKSREILIKLLE
ncbi:MAG: Asp-tRNA(Asn)/Glu-tRNA(Gln) amidotransferase subunit GatB [Nanoarchaeota archaeon]